MVDGAVVLGVTGIVVSGIVGPAVASRMARKTRTREFHREQVASRRDKLRVLLDEAAGLLAVGPTSLRLLHDQGPDPDDLRQARTWLSEVFPIGQRLQLWLPYDHPVVMSYEQVREQLVSGAQASTSDWDDALLQRFEDARREFLVVSRELLLSPIRERGGAL